MTGYVFSPEHLRPEHPDERRFFDNDVALSEGNVLLCIAHALRIWGAVQPGGSYADQCTIMANELLKLAGTKPAEKEKDEVVAEYVRRNRYLKERAKMDMTDGIGACDALYELAVKHGAPPHEAAGHAHNINGAFSLMLDGVYDAVTYNAKQWK